jgi:Gpi18-like mannosyltransferase
LVYRIARTLKLNKTREIIALYALNPFILMEFMNNGHNDVWMVALGLLALYCYHARKDDGIVPALILAGLIKYVFWLLIPLFLVFLWRERRLHLKLIFRSGLLSSVFLAAGYLPFWHGGAALNGILDQSGVQRPFNQYSPIILIFFVVAIARRWPIEALKSGLILGRSLFLAIYAKTLVSAKNLEPAMVLILTAFAFLATGTVLPWYILWWLPFLVLRSRLRPIMVWSSIGMGSYLFIYSTSLSLALVGGIYLVFLGTRNLDQ